MDAISKELETWNLTFLGVLATHINLMLRKYFSVLVEVQNVNVICKFLNAEKDKTATLESFSCEVSHFKELLLMFGVAL